ncbi:hypothetical protein [Microbulbifer spongiae]|uniref:EF-hand domain-containing protein n=1 Tax=Microbulbifer spongiae TaxID=2944933 RepID=A0ABY9EEN8_9GAMM|nr:hypothetical protein [Microbulbifer sp. MI-G]WKD50717.1 hypothetical protein M8T91_04620 [Microbulbifer sp. MI-G]
MSNKMAGEYDENGAGSLSGVDLFRKNCHVFAYAVPNYRHPHRHCFMRGKLVSDHL